MGVYFLSLPPKSTTRRWRTVPHRHGVKHRISCFPKRKPRQHILQVLQPRISCQIRNPPCKVPKLTQLLASLVLQFKASKVRTIRKHPLIPGWLLGTTRALRLRCWQRTILRHVITLTCWRRHYDLPVGRSRGRILTNQNSALTINGNVSRIFQKS